MKIQILYADKRGGHCKVVDEDKASKLLDRLAKRKLEAKIQTIDGKAIGGVAAHGAWGYAL